MKPLLLFLALLLASCAPKALVVPPAPVKVEAVAPKAKAVREAVEVADKRAGKIADAAKDASLLATQARQEAERLAQAKVATEQELTKLWQDLQTVEARNLFLETETKTLSVDLSNTLTKVEELEDAAALKDAESTALRAQNDELRRTSETAIKQRDSEKARADKLAGEIRLYRYVAGGIAFLLVIYILAKIFLPPRIF